MHSRRTGAVAARPDDMVIETRHDRRALIADAGIGRVSLISIVAGTLVAFGAFVVMLAVAGGIAATIGVDDLNLGSRDFRELSVGGGIAVAVVLFLSYLLGGYVAGRMARRSGMVHGFLSLLLGGLIAGGLAAWVISAGGTERMVDGVRSVGLPTTAQQWRDIGTFAGIAAVAAALIGSLAGGAMGERWHTKVLSRALDPSIGPEGRIRESADGAELRAADAHTAAETRVDRARARRDRYVDLRDVATARDETAVPAADEVRGDARMPGVVHEPDDEYVPRMREDTTA
jgi:hypothetical protein